jgi:antitoxin (DNA-binding transcriptional repressor) of toxin-antitoxin stability system
MRLSFSGLPPLSATSRRVGWAGVVTVMVVLLFRGAALFITRAAPGGNAARGVPGYTRCMKSVQLSELGPVAEDVRRGERVEVRDGERIIAAVVPIHQAALETRVQELAAQGLVRLGSSEPLPEDFFTRPLPKAERSVLEQLLADREED